MTEEEITQQKQVGYYNAAIAAWFNTSLEHDKTLFTLASGGIGLLLTLLNFGSVKDEPCAALLFIVAAFCFAVCVFAVLAIFRRNKTHLEAAVAGNAPSSDPVLEMLDGAAIWSFGLGVAFTAIIVVLAAVLPYLHKGTSMANENKGGQSGQTQLNESFNQVSKLQVPSGNQKSFNGAVNLQPQATPAATPAATQATPAAQPTAQQTPSPTPAAPAKDSGK